MMVVKTAPDLDADKMFKLVPGSSLKPFENKKKKIVSSSSEEEILSESEEEEVSLAKEIQPKPTDEIIEEDIASASESEEEVEFLDVEAGLLSGDSDIEVVEEQDDTIPDSKKPLASYDFKSKEGRFSEEFAYQNSRKKRLGQLDKKQRHLLLFTNYDQLNFVNINNSDFVKAWVILYHFRSKSMDSHLFEEFSSIVTRNSSNKSKGHELFSKFYNTLLGLSYQSGLRVHLSRKCEKTGWPIDLTVTSEDGKEKALYFLL
jgi:hypothetical protein